jgi:hypothetical protein
MRGQAQSAGELSRKPEVFVATGSRPAIAIALCRRDDAGEPWAQLMLP